MEQMEQNMDKKSEKSESFKTPDQGGVPNNPQEINDLVKEQNTAEKNVKLTDEKVDEVKKEASQTAANTTDDVDKNMVKAIDSEKNGFEGKKVNNMFKSISGPIPVAASQATPLLRANIRVGTNDVVRIEDVDKADRNMALAESMYDAINSEVTDEAVRGTDNSDQAIIGDPSDVNVYSEQTTIVSETVVRRTKKYGQYEPRHRSSGTTFHRKNFITSISGDEIDMEYDVTNDVLITNGHTYAKGLEQKENLLFNRLGPDGGYLRDQFVMPKTGYFIVHGINPTPTTSAFTQIGTVRRGGPGGWHMARVYQSTGNGIFDVEDVTPLVSDATQAAEDTMELLTCNKSKMKRGQYEAMVNAFLTLADKKDNRDLLMYPELNLYRNRCSLNSIKGISTLDVDLDCHNSLESYVHFMQAISESEAMYIPFRLNHLNIAANAKVAKSFEGMQPRYSEYDHTYWRNILKANPSNAHISSPTTAAYLATMASPNRFNRPAAFLYGMREFWSKLELHAQLIDDGDLKTAIFDKVFLATEVLDQLQAKLSIGSISDPTHVTSDARVELADVGHFILNFDPNDLVDFIGSFTHSADGRTLNYTCRAFPACGYVNVYTGEGGYIAETATYNVIPTWLDTIIRIISSNRAIQRLLNYRETSGYTDSNVFHKYNMLQYQYDHEVGGLGSAYHPLVIDTYMPSWITYWFNDGMAEVQHDVLSNNNQRSGYFRYLSMLQEFTDSSIYTQGKVSLSTILTSLVNNDYIKMDEHCKLASDFKVFDNRVIAKKFNQPDDSQLAVFNHIDLSAYNPKWSSKQTCIVFNPSRLDHHVSSLEGWMLTRPDGSGGEVEIDAGTIHELLEQFENANSAATETSLRLWPSLVSGGDYTSIIDTDSQFQILLYSEDDYDKGTPVMLRRLVNDKGAKTVLVATDDANPATLGFSDNPQEYMYGDDGFQNLAPCDGYFLIVRTAERIGADGMVQHSCITTEDIMICPFIAIDEVLNTTSTALAVSGVKKYKALRSRFAKAKNQIYETTATVNATTGVITGDTVNCLERVGSNGINSYFNCLPSLYGYERAATLYDGFTYITDSAAPQAQLQPCYLHAANSYPGAQSITRWPGLYPTQIFQYSPEDFEWPDNDEGQVPLGVANYRNYLTDRFAVNVPAASDWRWYCWQDYHTCGYDDSDLANGVDVSLINLAMMDSKPLLQEHVYPIVALSTANINATATVITDTIGNNAKYALLETAESIKQSRYYEDRCNRMFKHLYKSPESNRIRFGTGDYTVATVKRPQYIFLNDVDADKNSDLHSELCYNDIRVYRTDKPVRRLNDSWNAIGMTRSLFAEQFKSQN